MKSLFGAVFVVLVCIGSITSLAYAQEIHLALYPPIIEIVTTPGNTFTVAITLTNLSTQNQNVTASFKSFRPEGEDGTIVFTDDNKGNSFFTLAQEGKAIGESLDLRPNEKRELSLVVKVPQEASGSGFVEKDIYTALLLQTKNTTKPSQTVSKVEAGIGSNILVAVRRLNGTTIISASLKEFSIPTVLFDQPTKPILRVENKGEHFIKVKGEIAIFDIAGKEVKKVTLPMQNILALSTRDISSQLEPISIQGLFGKYRAEAKVDLGEGKILSKSITFYAIPKKVGIIFIIILFGFSLLLIRFHLYARELLGQKLRVKKKSKALNVREKKAI